MSEKINIPPHVCVRTGVSYECSCGWHLEGGTDVVKCNFLYDHIVEMTLSYEMERGLRKGSDGRVWTYPAPAHDSLEQMKEYRETYYPDEGPYTWVWRLKAGEWIEPTRSVPLRDGSDPVADGRVW